MNYYINKEDAIKNGFKESEKGQAVALGKAERSKMGWADDALNAYKLYAETNEFVLGSEVRDWAYENGYVSAVDNNNAWGPIAKKAVKAGYIKQHGYQPSTSEKGHARLCRVYKSLIYSEV